MVIDDSGGVVPLAHRRVTQTPDGPYVVTVVPAIEPDDPDHAPAWYRPTRPHERPEVAVGDDDTDALGGGRDRGCHVDIHRNDLRLVRGARPRPGQIRGTPRIGSAPTQRKRSCDQERAPRIDQRHRSQPSNVVSSGHLISPGSEADEEVVSRQEDARLSRRDIPVAL